MKVCARLQVRRRARAARRVLEASTLAVTGAALDRSVARAHVRRDHGDVETGRAPRQRAQRVHEHREGRHQVGLRRRHRRRVVDDEQHVDIPVPRAARARRSRAPAAPPRRACPARRRHASASRSETATRTRTLINRIVARPASVGPGGNRARCEQRWSDHDKRRWLAQKTRSSLETAGRVQGNGAEPLVEVGDDDQARPKPLLR